jgi:hypothetical protein
VRHSIVKADALAYLRAQPWNRFNLVFGSPPYELARLYLEGGKNLGLAMRTRQWVKWMADIYEAAQYCCKGLVAFVVAGQTDSYRWSAGPALLAAELVERGLWLRNPLVFHRVGIPGSGAKDWLRSDYEWILCTSRPGRLPWSDNTAMGHAPKWAPGGEMSHRLSSGERRNQWGSNKSTNHRKKDGSRAPIAPKPSHRLRTKGGSPKDIVKDRAKWGTGRRVTRGNANGDTQSGDFYDPPVKANPGNMIEQTYTFTASQLAELMGGGDVRKLIVGGGVMGDDLCHQNEAPFPEKLAEFMIRTFCPPGGHVCDPFSGSGTTAKVAKMLGRQFSGCDIRQSQVNLTKKRLALV